MSSLTKVSLFSPWYSYRLFSAHTGLTPTEYIRKLRLSKSALRLKNEDCRILDVAFDFGFGSVDGYQRAFHREFGCNPGEYARNPVPITLFIPYGVKFKEPRKDVQQMENLQSVFIQVIQKPERKVIIRRGIAADKDYRGEIPQDFDVITLPESEYLMFQGEPFQEENYNEAILVLQQAMNRYDPAVIGYDWNEESPRIQLEPRGERGYIELRAVKRRTV